MVKDHEDRDEDRTGTGMQVWDGGGVSNGAAVAWVTGASRDMLSACPLALALGVGRPARMPPVTACVREYRTDERLSITYRSTWRCQSRTRV